VLLKHQDKKYISPSSYITLYSLSPINYTYNHSHITLTPYAYSAYTSHLATLALERTRTGLLPCKPSHGRRDVTKALLLPSIFRYKSIYTKWPPPVPRARSVRKYAITSPSYAYWPAPHQQEPFIHKNSNK
jgi:hypothetical protein